MQAEIKPVAGIRFELISAEDYAACARLVDECFHHDEPFGDALFGKAPESVDGSAAKEAQEESDKPEGLARWLLPMQDELLALNLSHKAVDEASGRVIGAFFVCEGHVPDLDLIARVNANMGELYRELYRQWQPRPKTTLQYLFSGVLPEYRRRGILSVARRQIIARGKQKGFTSIYSETSSYGSRRSLEQLGAQERAFISYKTWQNSLGERPFAQYLAGATAEKPIPHTGFAVMEVDFA